MKNTLHKAARCLLFTILATVTPLARSVVYVDGAAAGLENGTSWANAYKDLRIAMAASREIGFGIGERNLSHRRPKAGSSGSVLYSAASVATACAHAPVSRSRKASMAALRKTTSRLCSKMSSCIGDVG